MNTISLYIALRYLFTQHKEQNISVMVRITFLSIFVGTFSLALVCAVMHGFETSTHQKLQSIHPEAIISSYAKELNVKAVYTVLQREFSSVAYLSPWAQEHVLIHNPEQENQPTVILLKGVNPQDEHNVTNIGTKILHPSNTSFERTVTGNRIAIGKKLAQELEVTTGQTIDLFYLEQLESKKRSITMDVTPVVVATIFETGIDEFDSSLALCSLNFLQQTVPETSVSNIGLRFAPGTNQQQQIRKLQDRLQLEVYSWKDLYPAVVSALKLEKYVMFFLLILITFVAVMNMISLLFMQITHKRAEIALLLALGAPPSIAEGIFLWMGLLIALAGTLAGLLCAVAACIVIKKFPFIELPDVYYVTHLPAEINLSILVSVFVGVMSLSLGAIWLATRRIKKINVCSVLRHEG